MAQLYLKPGDRIETLCTLTYGEDGEFHNTEVVDSTEMHYFREDESHDEGGEWFRARRDFSGSRDSNPMWGRLYFDNNDPGY